MPKKSKLKKQAAPVEDAEEKALLTSVEGLIKPIEADPSNLLGNEKQVGSQLRDILSSLYQAGKVGTKAGLPKIYASGLYSVDQIIPQVEPLTDSVIKATEEYLKTEEVERENEEEEEPEDREDEEADDEKYKEFAELMAAEEMEEEEEEEAEGEEENEEEDEEELSEDLNPLLALGEIKKGTKIGAARKMLDKKEESDEIQNLINEYAPEKGKKKKKAKDEEELLLEKLEGMMGGDDSDDTDEADEAPLFSDLKQEKKPKKQQPPTKEEEDAIYDAPVGEEEDEEDDEIEVDDELMKEMKEDTAALKDLYGDHGYDEGETFGAPEMDEEEDEELDGEEGEEDEEEEELDPSLTPFQQKQLKLQKTISKIEKDRLGDKHWTLTGETMASNRPENALLEEHLEFDTTQQAKPLITAELTKSLEERLTKRIQESIFDDVVRKERRSTPMDLTIEHRNEIDLHAKSKVGLADLYEKEWLDNHRKQLENEGETSRELTEEEKEELKVIQMWRALSSNLDMLSNFYFTPKPMPEDELKVRSSQKSAIAMEEVTPAAVSAVTVPDFATGRQKRKFDNVGEDELTTSEKKRLRKTKKEMHQAKTKRIEHQKEKSEKGKKRFMEAKAALAGQ